MDSNQSIIQDLNDYAARWDLYVVEGRDAIIEAGGGVPDLEEEEVEELRTPAGVTHMAFFNDVTCAFGVAYLQDGELYRFGVEFEGEDPGEGVKTTFAELDAKGDPREWMA